MGSPIVEAYCILQKPYLCNRCTDSHQFKFNWTSPWVGVHCYVYSIVGQVIGCPFSCPWAAYHLTKTGINMTVHTYSRRYSWSWCESVQQLQRYGFCKIRMDARTDAWTDGRMDEHMDRRWLFYSPPSGFLRNRRGTMTRTSFDKEFWMHTS